MTSSPRALLSDRPGARVGLILLGGALAALLAAASGRLLAGADTAEAAAAERRAIGAEVQAAWSRIAEQLRMASGALADPALVEAAGGGDRRSLGRLFDLAAEFRGPDPDDVRAAAAYGASAQPLAWAGRPSDPASGTPDGSAGWFTSQNPSGLRLAYRTPVRLPDGRLAGSIVTEGELEGATPDRSGEDFVSIVRGVRVSIQIEVDTDAPASPDRLMISAPDGEVLAWAEITGDEIARGRRRLVRVGDSLGMLAGSIALLLTLGPLLTAWHPSPALRTGALRLLTGTVALLGARFLLSLTSPADHLAADVFSGVLYSSSRLGPFLASPFDFLVSALTALGLLLLLISVIEAARRRRAVTRLEPAGPLRIALFSLGHLAAGAGGLAVLLMHQSFLADTVAGTSLELLQLSLHPWSLSRTCLQIGLVVWHLVSLGLVVLLFVVAGLPWRRRAGVPVLKLLPPGLWTVSLAAGLALEPMSPDGLRAVAFAAATTVAAAVAVPVVRRRRRLGSQAGRFLTSFGLVAAPALACYPLVFTLASDAERELIETSYAPQALNQRQTIQRVLQESLAQIDAVDNLDQLVAAGNPEEDADAATGRAFGLWQRTNLAGYPITSSVELFDASGTMVSRFAFNLPEDLARTPSEEEDQCSWTIYEEVSPFFAEERRVLHAGRAVCARDSGGGPPFLGSVVVHAILDYANLAFIASQSPYVELLRPGGVLLDESYKGRDVEYSVYGWSGRALYASREAAWRVDPDLLARVGESRAPFWTRLTRSGDSFDVYLLNDRGGVYALGLPRLSLLDHAVNLAELVVLAAVTYLLLAVFSLILDVSRGQATTGRALLREVRASFYRKLFLAFVAASAVPVVTLAVLTRNYIADQLRTGIEQEAVRTVSAARRVVEDLLVARGGGPVQAVDDNLLVWVSRLIDQDVNVFRGTRLLATSERNLFASGVLSTRTPAEVYRAIALEAASTAVVADRAGLLSYLVAATPVTTRQFDGILTMPLTMRQRDIEGQIDTLNRLVLLGALLFLLGGAGIGYSLAERIADPVNRLTRATRRIARGELDVHIAATSSDELRRLVDDFNGMARDLRAQRAELERTNRLAAWAEMARQVAHDIKNPLTPIQLNAEHLRRVHTDRGTPLSPVLEECVANILTQVSLLRSIASEFSNFASQPVVQRTTVSLQGVVEEVTNPYIGGLDGRIAVVVDVPADLPLIVADKMLLSRAIANVIENALHAMPDGGTLRLSADRSDADVTFSVSDTGGGMDAAALARAFEPYFSTKVSGTGLGLPIARRNIELCGGSVRIASTPGQGTSVIMTLPIR